MSVSGYALKCFLWFYENLTLYPSFINMFNGVSLSTLEETNMGQLLVIVGYRGSGKRSLVQEIIRQHPDARLVRSITTRTSHPRDIKGHYEHISVLEFTIKLWSGLLLWESVYRGIDDAWYRIGTHREAIEEIRETEGALDIMLLVPDAAVKLANIMKAKGRAKDFIPVFLRAPEPKEHIRRLKMRGASDTVINRCVKEAKHWEP